MVSRLNFQLHSADNQLLFAAKKKKPRPPAKTTQTVEQPAVSQASVPYKPNRSLIPPEEALHTERLLIEDRFEYSRPGNFYAKTIDPTGRKFNASVERKVQNAVAGLLKMPNAARNVKANYIGDTLALDDEFADDLCALSFNYSTTNSPASFVIIIPKPEIKLSAKTKQYYSEVNRNKSASVKETQDAQNEMRLAEIERDARQKKFDKALDRLEDSIKRCWLQATLPAGCWILDVDAPNHIYCTSDPADVRSFKKKQKPFTQMRLNALKGQDQKALPAPPPEPQLAPSDLAGPFSLAVTNVKPDASLILGPTASPDVRIRNSMTEVSNIPNLSQEERAKKLCIMITTFPEVRQKFHIAKLILSSKPQRPSVVILVPTQSTTTSIQQFQEHLPERWMNSVFPKGSLIIDMEHPEQLLSSENPDDLKRLRSNHQKYMSP